MTETTWRLPKGAYLPANKEPEPVLREVQLPTKEEFIENSLDLLVQQAPAHWSKGALLNVRNAGEHYIVTLYPEEYDPRYQERALKFTNTALCQDFISKWYMRENPDPRAR